MQNTDNEANLVLPLGTKNQNLKSFQLEWGGGYTGALFGVISYISLFRQTESKIVSLSYAIFTHAYRFYILRFLIKYILLLHI